MTSKAAGVVAYLTWVGFVVSLVMGDTNDPFVKQHLNQALILNIIGSICGVCSGVLGMIPLVRIFAALVFGLIGIATFVLWLIGILSAATGSDKPIPVIGEIKIFS